jgi:hypothetical protein
LWIHLPSLWEELGKRVLVARKSEEALTKAHSHFPVWELHFPSPLQTLTPSSLPSLVKRDKILVVGSEVSSGAVYTVNELSLTPEVIKVNDGKFPIGPFRTIVWLRMAPSEQMVTALSVEPTDDTKVSFWNSIICPERVFMLARAE